MTDPQRDSVPNLTRIDEGTRDRILDAAERLFAEHGYEGTSVRAINSEASVNSGAIHYYFRTKDELFRAVINRRGQVLASERMAALAACVEAPGRPPLVEQIVAAYIGPYAAPALGSREKRLLFARLRAKLMADNRDIDSSPLGPAHEATGRRFVAALSQTLPHLRPEEIELRYLIMWGALNTLSAGLGRTALGSTIDRGIDPIGEFEAMMPRLVALFARLFRMSQDTTAALRIPGSGMAPKPTTAKSRRHKKQPQTRHTSQGG